MLDKLPSDRWHTVGRGAVQGLLHDRLQARIADHCCGRLSKRPCTATGGVADSHIEWPPTLDVLIYRTGGRLRSR